MNKSDVAIYLANKWNPTWEIVEWGDPRCPSPEVPRKTVWTACGAVPKVPRISGIGTSNFNCFSDPVFGMAEAK